MIYPVPETLGQLMKCASLMVQRQVAPVSFYDLEADFRNASAVMLQFLTAEVESRSEGLFTVRLVDPALVRTLIPGPTLYVAVRPVETPPGIVTELTPAMALYSLSPHRNGLRSQVAALPAQTARYRKAVADRAGADAHLANGRTAVALIKHSLVRALRELVSRCEDPFRIEQANQFLQGEPDQIPLEQIAAACDALAVDLNQLLRDRMSH